MAPKRRIEGESAQQTHSGRGRRLQRSEIIARENFDDSQHSIVAAAHWSFNLERSADAIADCRYLVAEHFETLRRSLCSGPRTVEQRARRAHAVEVVSSFYTRLVGQIMQRPDALLLLQRLEVRQITVRRGLQPPRPPDEIETLILDLSDLLALLKDPCHGSMLKHRRLGIARHPGSAMPYFRRPLSQDRDTGALRDPESVTWVVLADRDALEWVEDPFVDGTFKAESGDKYQIFMPAPDLRGDVPIRRFSRWLDLSRATEFRIRERKKQVGKTRVVKADSDFVGFYENSEGRKVVNLEAYVLDLIERRTPHCPTVPLVLIETAAEAAQAEAVAVPTPPRQITRSEELLEHLEAEAIENLRLEFLSVIEAERAAGEFIVLDLRVDVK